MILGLILFIFILKNFHVFLKTDSIYFYLLFKNAFFLFHFVFKICKQNRMVIYNAIF